ncbi:DgyrCDS2919 [Dimorphilus gyrociliatus]|uniref:DgyrCDS2919 n=1 Tax=Dimorphilus gyrociliatus TaxID=2664684 RepID=A0A7I8VCW6_9ANNE|nr:DgyrCDS2919 [Dimorphilus gyrociliatus]
MVKNNRDKRKDAQEIRNGYLRHKGIAKEIIDAAVVEQMMAQIIPSGCCKSMQSTNAKTACLQGLNCRSNI